MDFLDLPLGFENGSFRRTSPETVLSRYVALFFATRKYEADPSLDFGMDLDELAWISSEEYLRVMIDEFNRVHRGSMTLLVSGQSGQGADRHVGLTLRHGRSNYMIRLAMGTVMDA
jgi:hypothetical protein